MSVRRVVLSLVTAWAMALLLLLFVGGSDAHAATVVGCERSHLASVTHE